MRRNRQVYLRRIGHAQGNGNLANETIRYVHELLSGRVAAIRFVHNPIYCTILFPLHFKHFSQYLILVN